MSSKSVEQIKERLPINDIISSYIKLDRAGANYKGKCPFHNEKTPSFMVSPERGSYYCFGCGAKGDVFTFVQEFEKIDFKDALALLADRAGVVLESYGGNDGKKEEDDEKEKLRKIMEAASSFYEDSLKNDDKALEYLKSRGLEDKTVKEWRLGSTKLGWNNLYDYLKALGFPDEGIEKAGLAKMGNHGFYDRFRSRIMFPIFDQNGKIVAFTGRFKEWEKEETKEGKEEIVAAKYLNSPDTILFDKSRTLYGFHKTKPNISKWKFSLLVEGQMDLLMCHQAGFTNAIATSGTALTKPQLEMLARFSKNLLIAYDGDKAGVEAARRAWILALSLAMDVKMAIMPPGLDPADIIIKDAAIFKEILRKGSHIVEFYLNALIARGLQDRELGKAIESDLLPYVKAIESPIDQAHFISLISSRTGIKEEVIAESLKRVGAPSAMPQALPSEREGATMQPQNNRSTDRLIAGTYLLLKDEENAQKYIANATEIRDELMFPVEEWLSHNKETPDSYLKELLSREEKDRLHKRLEELMRKGDEADREEIRGIIKQIATFK